MNKRCAVCAVAVLGFLAGTSFFYRPGPAVDAELEEAYGRVVIGMTGTEVQAILGRCENATISSYGCDEPVPDDKSVEIRFWRGSAHTASVAFNTKDRVVSSEYCEQSPQPWYRWLMALFNW